MRKQWIKNSDFNYSFWVDENMIGEMQIHFNTISSKAICKIGKQVLEINRTGFWRSSLEIIDSKEGVLLKTFPEKWYANTSIIEFENNKYKLLIRNNPLAEYAITQNDKDILAYGLGTENSKLNVRISTSENANFIFDFLLWYLFLPIAIENFGESFYFLTSQSA